LIVNKHTISYLTLSVIGALMILVVSWFGSTSSQEIQTIDRIVVGLAFILSCIFGISFAIRPGWGRKIIGKSRHGANSPQESERRARIGHHPDCIHFRSHIIKTKRKALCAGCTGLMVGAILGVVLMSIFVTISIEIPTTVLYILLLIGMLLVVFNFLDILKLRNLATVHAAFNSLLVVGFFFVVIGVFYLAGRFVYGLVSVLISLLWLDTRIHLSHQRHNEICRNCSSTCKAY